MTYSKVFRSAKKRADAAQIKLHTLATKKTKLTESEKVDLVSLRNYAVKMIKYIDNLKFRL